MGGWLTSRRVALVLVGVVAYWYCFFRFIPPGPLKPGPTTTIFSGPLNARGFVDFGRAFNARRGVVAPADNAAIPLIEVCGPRCLPHGADASATLVLMGLPASTTLPAPLVRLETVIGSNLANPNVRPSAWTETHRRYAFEPWTASGCPEMASFVATNTTAWATLHDASRRPVYFWPAFPDRAFLAAQPFSHFRDGVLLESFRGLRGRAMLRLAGGEFADAWDDLSASLRLGRLLADEPFILPAVVGLVQLGGCRVAIRSWIDAVASLPRSLAEPLVAAAKADLDRALPLPDVGRALQTEVRINAVGMVNDFAQGRGSLPAGRCPVGSISSRASISTSCANCSTTTPTTSIGRWRRRRPANAFGPSPYQVETDLRSKRMSQWYIGQRLIELIFFTSSWRKSECAAGFIGEILTAIATPKYGSILSEAAVIESGLRLDRLALDLLEHRWRTGAYPAALTDLGLASATATLDCLASAPFVYRREGAGFLLYGVGADLVDSGGVEGATRPDDPAPDVVIRLQL